MLKVLEILCSDLFPQGESSNICRLLKAESCAYSIQQLSNVKKTAY